MVERPGEVCVDFEVPFHDVDALATVWHGHYYKYFELARSRLLRKCGLDDHPKREARYSFVIVESRCRHTGTMACGDRARVHAWFRDTRRRIAIAYEVWNLSADHRAARGLTTLVTLDADGRRLPETPEPIRQKLPAISDANSSRLSV